MYILGDCFFAYVVGACVSFACLLTCLLVCFLACLLGGSLFACLHVFSCFDVDSNASASGNKQDDF